MITKTVLSPQHVRDIGKNFPQFALLTLQVMFVGLVLGSERTVLPTLAGDFGVAQGAFLWLASFVIAFGVVKGLVNLVAGTLADRVGRKRVLLLGWAASLPVPFLIFYAPNWSWVVVANIFLGINQGLAWSVTVISMVDVAGSNQRGLAVGINEFGGYAAVGIAGLVTGLLAARYGPRSTIVAFVGIAVVVASIAALFVVETRGWAHAESEARQKEAADDVPRAHVARTRSTNPGLGEIFTLVSFRHPTFRALSQAGVTNKIADTLVWVVFPIYLHDRGFGLGAIGWVTGVYAAVWGGSQLWSGPLSDRVGRKWLITWGFWFLALGITGVLLLSSFALLIAAAALMGIGMAMLYSNLIAAVNDISDARWRGASLGVYRYWRDTGYAVGGIVLGVIVQTTSHVALAFWTTAVILVASGVWVALGAEETHPRKRRATNP